MNANILDHLRVDPACPSMLESVQLSQVLSFFPPPPTIHLRRMVLSLLLFNSINTMQCVFVLSRQIVKKLRQILDDTETF